MFTRDPSDGRTDRDRLLAAPARLFGPKQRQRRGPLVSASKTVVGPASRAKARAIRLSAVFTLLILVVSACADRQTLSAGKSTTPPTPTSTADPTADWVITPGRVGPIKVGIDGGDAKLRGFAQGARDKNCGVVWVESEALAAAGIQLEFRDGRNSDDLDFILASDPAETSGEPTAFPGIRTAEGVGVGTPFAEVRRIYGEQLVRGKYLGEGGTGSGTRFRSRRGRHFRCRFDGVKCQGKWQGSAHLRRRRETRQLRAARIRVLSR